MDREVAGESTELGEWDDLWNGQVSGSPRNCEDELTCESGRCRGVHEIARMN